MATLESPDSAHPSLFSSLSMASASSAALQMLSSKAQMPGRATQMVLLQHRLHVRRQNCNKAISPSRWSWSRGKAEEEVEVESAEATEERADLGWRAFDTVLKVKWV